MPVITSSDGVRYYVAGLSLTPEERAQEDRGIAFSPAQADAILVRISPSWGARIERQRQQQLNYQVQAQANAQQNPGLGGQTANGPYFTQEFINNLRVNLGMYGSISVPPTGPLPEPYIEEPEPEESKKMKLINTFKIGCDPEFLVLDTSARPLNMTRIVGSNAKIGWDHSGDVGELRPNPCKSAWSLTKGLQTLINDERLKYAGIGRLRGGAYVEVSLSSRGAVSLGGHIHIDLNPYTPKMRGTDAGGDFDPEDMEPYSFSQYSVEHGYRMRALDQLTDRLENLDILPREESLRRRASTAYGRFGSFRAQANPTRYDPATGMSVSSHRTEYRTMASWLHSPKITMLCLTGAKLACAYPKDALEALGKERGSFERLCKLYSLFAPKDDDAKRAEGLLAGGVKGILAPLDTDFREHWRVGA